MNGTRPTGRPVLVTGGDYLGPLATIRALRAAGHQPWATITSRHAYAARSRATCGTLLVPDPLADEAGFLAAVGDGAERIGFSAVICGTEQDLIALSEAGEKLALLLPEGRRQRVLDATSKKLLYEMAPQVGLAVPPTREMSSDELESATLQFPVVIKPLRSVERVAGRLTRFDAALAQGPQVLAGLLRQAPHPMLVQARLEGPMGAIAGLAWKGEIIGCHHQMADRIWPPGVGSSAYARTVARDPNLEERVAELLRRLRWSGIFQFQFIHCASGPHLIDFNPRVYGSIALAVAAGLNLPAMLVSLLAGETPERSGYSVGVRFRSEEKDPLALMRLLRRGQVGHALAGSMPRRRTVHPVASLRDPAPLLTTLQKARRRSDEASD